MRTIDADALKEAFVNSEHIKETTDGLDVMEMLAIKEIIDTAPTVEPDCSHCKQLAKWLKKLEAFKETQNENKA